MGQSLSETNLVAARMTSSADFTKTGNFRHPGERNIRTKSFRVSWNKHKRFDKGDWIQGKMVT